jgi:hypothetical protein
VTDPDPTPEPFPAEPTPEPAPPVEPAPPAEPAPAFDEARLEALIAKALADRKAPAKGEDVETTITRVVEKIFARENVDYSVAQLQQTVTEQAAKLEKLTEGPKGGWGRWFVGSKPGGILG